MWTWGWGSSKLDNFHGRHMCIIPNSRFLSWLNLKRKIKNKRIERKKRLWGSYQMILIHWNVSNRTILIHLNISKFFKKQHNNTLQCFVNRSSFDESSNSMDEAFFSKKIEVTGFIRILFPWTTIGGQSKEY